MRKLAVVIVLCGVSLFSQWPLSARGHAAATRAEPPAGATVKAPPTKIRIWFDSALKPGLCIIRVQNSSGKQIDNGDCRVNPSDEKLLEVTLPSLSPGTYHVIWSVVSHDGHKTTGDYTFTIKPED
jgi:methionine-rich copper-binding protein CopC